LPLYFNGKQIVETSIFTAKAFWTLLRNRQSIILPRCQINKYYATIKRDNFEAISINEVGNDGTSIKVVKSDRFITNNRNHVTVSLISDESKASLQ
jgi:hypothetical protein